MRANDGAWIGWPGGADDELEPFVEDGLSLVPVPLTRRGDRGVLRGLLQRHPVAALPRRRAPSRSSTASGGTPTSRSTGASPTGRRGRRRGRDGVGARLPAAAGARDAARAAARPADRLLPAHPVPAGRAVPAAAVAPPDPRGPARRRPGRLPAARRARRTSSAWCASGSATRPTATWSTCPTGAIVQAARSRSPSTPRASRSWPAGAGRDAGRGDPRAARQPHEGAARRRPARLHQGHLRPAARVRRAGRRRATSTSRTPSSSRSRRRRASGSSSTACCATTSTGWSAGINGDLGRIGRPAIHYLHASYPREEMAALFRAADVMVVTPLRDGMNLVAKEYVACRFDDDGRAGALRVRRRGRRAAAGVPGQPLRHQRHEGGDRSTAIARRARGPRPADEGDAQDGGRARRRATGPREFLAVLDEAKPPHHKHRPARRDATWVPRRR